jgi:D-glycero-alpha-D-manno-heptose-7-phosphate kinase
MRWSDPINISTMSDIPGGTGLGSSSAFTVGLLKLLNHLAHNSKDRLTLAKDAFRIEHDILKENVGIQDHLHASFGGLNLYRLNGSKVTIEPVQLCDPFKQLLNTSLLMIYTGEQRHASNVLSDQINSTKKKINTVQIKELVELTLEAANMLQTNTANDVTLLKEFGLVLQRGWDLKKSFSSKITNSSIDEIYKKGLALGALGGKLCGAGAGGFLLFIAEKEKHHLFKKSFGEKNVLEISLTNSGSFIKEI